ncbi:hypothetical protein [Methylobacterium sp. NFXW15]|uniref:hypothetical protein n=1 Tax=Methylobacterium sp. NFXW15 TaxID=2819512 RepID=UPI003CEBFDA7
MGRVETIRPVSSTSAADTPPSRALTIIAGGRREEASRASSAVLRDGRTESAFVTQLLVGADPTLQPSRSARAQIAATRYAETARRLA